MHIGWLLCVFCFLLVDAKKPSSEDLIEDISDPKDYKKLLRTKTNVMVLYSKTARDASKMMKLYAQVAEAIKGQATLAQIDCSGEGKKLCRKLKITPEPTILKHYKNGEFHKDYDRKETLKSMVNFLKDPSGDMPWDEDETSQDVVHIPDTEALGKLLHKDKAPIMIMFYAPWCGFCKRMKPDYAGAATELKGHSILAAMDVDKPENTVVRRHFNITGFPTILYFDAGNLKMKYEGENTKESIVKFLKNPVKQASEKPKEQDFFDGSNPVVALSDATFDSFMEQNPSVLVMFYAPWCGHCKKMKPDFIDASMKLEAKGLGKLAALDATKEKAVAEKFKITGYPAVKYFKDGKFEYDVPIRTADKIEEFMENPQEPPPPPPPEVPWHETATDVLHLDEESFKTTLRRKKHALTMFYAPWCGHCKKAKPEFETAAKHFKDDPRVELVAVDCTTHTTVCSGLEVKGYPTFIYFSYLKTQMPYEGGRTAADFVSFLENPTAPPTQPPPPSPEEWWSELPGAQHVHHLNSGNFKEFLKTHDSVLVMFYAPWCGHCKSMKPNYAEAASILNKDKIPGKLAAVDATLDSEISSSYDIKGFPTLKYFSKGQILSDYNKRRTTEDLVEFMKSPPTGKDEL